jgi:GT2 family glycosyltransferase
VTVALSVVIPSWNTADDTLRCLDSLPDGGPGLEVILVDNASTDDTVDRVGRAHPDVRVIVMERNAGYAAACNRGCEAARGRMLLFLNSDTILNPETLDAMVAALESESDVGCVGPRLVGRTGALQPSTRTDPAPGALLNQHTILRHLRILGACEKHYKMRDFDFDRRTDVDVVMGAAMLLRRDAMDAAGPFDERYFMYFEEADLCRRVREAGWRVVFDPSAELTHTGGVSSRRAGADLEVAYVRSLLGYVKRWTGPVRGTLFAALFLPTYLVRRVELLCRDVTGFVLCVLAGRDEEADRRARSVEQGLDLLTRRLFEVVSGAF